MRCPTHFCPKLIHNSFPWKKVGTSSICQKLPKENNRPIGENSPNLVTLFLVNDIFGPGET
jgi:hypothetical protein